MLNSDLQLIAGRILQTQSSEKPLNMTSGLANLVSSALIMYLV